MSAIKVIAASIILTGSLLLAQSDQFFTDPAGQRSSYTSLEKIISQENLKDYKIIGSNSSFIEIEFTPQKLSVQKIQFNTETFEVYDFDNASSYDPKLAGEPNLKHRAYSVSLPSERGNVVQVIDYDVKEFQNVNLAPYPFVNHNNRGIKGFESIVYSFIKGSKYNENKFLPENIASLESIGIVRDLTTGRLNVTPMQYNPATGVLKIYSRIRIRVSFGTAPVLFNRPRTKEEINLLRGMTLNSDIGINWVNPKFSDGNRQTPAPSVLSSGDWYKIEITDPDDGSSNRIYKIKKNVLEGAGINLTGIDPRKIKLYGNGGNYLNENFNMPRPGDLQEIAVNFVGQDDGSFDANDYILFYGKSIHSWRRDTLAAGFNSHILNVYSKHNYYWLCLNTPDNGKRMALQPSSSNSPQFTPSSFTEKVFREKEQVNLLNEGNLWLEGPKRNNQSFEWPVTLTGLEGGSDIIYKIKPASRCLRPPDANINYMLLKDEYSSMPEINFPMFYVTIGFGDWIWTQPTSFTINQSQKTNGEQVKFRATYMSNAPEADGYIDWWEIIYKRSFSSAQSDNISFDSPDVTGTVEYNVSSFSSNDVKVFDVTDHNNVKLVQAINLSASNVKFRKDESQGNLSKFFVTGPGGFKDVQQGWISSKISNQNIRGITDGASLLVITHRDLLQAAARVKAKREAGGPSDPSYLKTKIFTTDQIYNEFSGGVLDVTAIRDFVKHAYDNWSERPVYVLLYGDGHFDYKNIYQPPIPNYVPAFEITHPSINQVDGYTTDDYYVNVVGGSIPPGDPPDMSIGRIPANSLQEANDYMDKVDCYENGQSNGYWKNKMVFVSDDQTTSDGCEGVFHLAQNEELAEYHTPPTIDKIKIYLVTYPTVITPQGRRKPQVNTDIIKYWNDGAIDVHYAGHGSPDVWAHEYVLEKDNVMSQLHNECKYPFVTIASCDMSKFDNPISQSAGELFMIQPRKGAIGTFAATRPVYAEGNATIMRRLFDNLYLVRDTLLLQQRLGRALFLTKQNLYSPNDLKYILMADPTIRIQIPRFRSRVDSISGLSNDTMRALSRIKIYGSIIKPDSSFWNDYNGSMLLKVYDVDRQITMIDPDCPQFTHSFRLNGGIIYAGTEGVNNGNWVAEFIVPKDISYRNAQGKLINYFFNSQADGSGIYRNFYVGGIDPTAPIDTTGPNISLYLNTRNFRTGDIVNKNFKLIADLFDESGINTTGTIGHKIEAIIDNNENNKYDLTNFYNSDTSYQSGTLEFDFTNFQESKHVLKLKAWDTYNNSSEKEIEFTVSDGTALKLSNVYNFPNPFSTNTTFTFQHNFPTAVDVRIKIYTVAGRLIKELSLGQTSDKFISMPWSGMDEDGETLGNGVYIYKILVETTDGQSVTEIGKLAVLK